MGLDMTVLHILVIVLISMVMWAFPYGLLLGAVVRAMIRLVVASWRTWSEPATPAH
jgi:hypothetical protein